MGFPDQQKSWSVPLTIFLDFWAKILRIAQSIILINLPDSMNITTNTIAKFSSEMFKIMDMAIINIDYKPNSLAGTYPFLIT